MEESLKNELLALEAEREVVHQEMSKLAFENKKMELIEERLNHSPKLLLFSL